MFEMYGAFSRWSCSPSKFYSTNQLQILLPLFSTQICIPNERNAISTNIGNKSTLPYLTVKINWTYRNKVAHTKFHYRNPFYICSRNNRTYPAHQKLLDAKEFKEQLHYLGVQCSIHMPSTGYMESKDSSYITSKGSRSTTMGDLWSSLV